MRKIAFWSIVCLAILPCLTVHAGGLRFVTQDFSPYVSNVDGVISGPATEIVQEVCATADLDCRIEMYPWGRALELVKTGKANALFVLAKNKERDEWLTFSPPVFMAEYGFFANKLSMFRYLFPENISGLTVAVYGPSNTETRLRAIAGKAEGCVIDVRPDDESGFRKLDRMRINAVFSNKHVGFALIDELKLGNVRYVGTDSFVKYHIGFSREYAETEAVSKFNETYETLYANGVIEAILRAYHMEAALLATDQP